MCHPSVAYDIVHITGDGKKQQATKFGVSSNLVSSISFSTFYLLISFTWNLNSKYNDDNNKKRQCS